MLFRLIGNENMKIYHRLRTWIFLGLILASTILVAVVIQNHQHTHANWKQELIQQDVSIQKSLAENANHMPAATVSNMQQRMELNQYYISHNIDPNRTTGWSFAQTAKGLSTLLIAFIVVVGADIVASEFSSGTIKMLLTQSATRSQILLSKYLATLLFAALGTVALGIFSIGVGGLFFGFGGANTLHFYVDPLHHVRTMSTVLYWLMSYGFLFIEVVVTVTIAFMISAIFRSSVLSISIALLAYLVGDTLVSVLSSFSFDKYILFANTDLSRYVEGGPMIKGMTLSFSITTLVIYYAVMLILSWLIFKKRDVAYN
jgi:ABC-2 type transport system permease protein